MLNLGFWVVGGNKYWVSFVNNYLYCWSLEELMRLLIFFDKFDDFYVNNEIISLRC